VDAIVAYPPIDPDRLPAPASDARTARPVRFMVGICGQAHKGADVFLELARRFPRRRFLLVGKLGYGYPARLRSLPNVRHLPLGPPRQFLGRAGVVLVPSRWPEPFGRVAVEAMAGGVPVLASRVGGLAEVVGDSALAVVDYRDPDAWERQRAVLRDSPLGRAANAAQGRSLAARFLGDDSVARMEATARALGAPVRPPADPRPVVALRGWAEGDAARWAEELQAQCAVRLVRAPDPSGFCPLAMDVTVVQDWAGGVASRAPAEGRLVVRVVGDAPLSSTWAREVDRACDQVWVDSRALRDRVVAAGVDPRRVRIVPGGPPGRPGAAAGRALASLIAAPGVPRRLRRGRAERQRTVPYFRVARDLFLAGTVG
jgi:hypothetical protein